MSGKDIDFSPRCPNDGCGSRLQPTRSFFRVESQLGMPEATSTKRILYCPQCYKGGVTP